MLCELCFNKFFLKYEDTLHLNQRQRGLLKTSLGTHTGQSRGYAVWTYGLPSLFSGMSCSPVSFPQNSGLSGRRQEMERTLNGSPSITKCVTFYKQCKNEEMLISFNLFFQQFNNMHNKYQLFTLTLPLKQFS